MAFVPGRTTAGQADDKAEGRPDGRWREQAREHYRALSRQDPLSAWCEMWLPSGMEGKRVLDVACRGGKGALEAADAVGPAGSVLGVDADPAFVERARAYAGGPKNKSGATNASFACAVPELLDEDGISAGSFDVAVCNTELNLFFDVRLALSQIERALAPNGMLRLAVVVADAPIPAERREAARARGDACGAALTEDELTAALSDVGFSSSRVVERHPVVLGGKRSAKSAQRPVPGVHWAIVDAQR